MDKISVYIIYFLKIFISLTFWGCGQEARRRLSPSGWMKHLLFHYTWHLRAQDLYSGHSYSQNL